MKKIFTLFAALAMVMSMSAAKLYLTPNSNWNNDNARFAAYFFGNGDKWISMTKVAGETNLYEVEAPAGYPTVIFCRMNPSASANNWNNRWNQTNDLTIPTDGKNHYTVKAGSWDKGGGEWTIWPVPTAKNYVDVTITVTANAAASIKWHSAGDKLANATDYVAMNAGENNTYTYTLAQVDDFSGVKYTIKVGDVVSEEQTTSTNVTADFKTLMKQAFLKGSMNDWGDKGKMTIADDYLTASIVLSLNAGSYEWKMYVGVDWLGGAKTVTRENNTHVLTDGDNCTLTADIKGNYTFTWTYATNTLTVTYPTVKYNVTVTAENGTVTGTGEYEEGKEATLTATPAEGYEFVNWTKGEEVVSTENPYKFTVTADVALVANFKKSVVTITKSFDLTPENVGNRFGRQTISVEDVDLGSVQLVIEDFSTEVTEYAEASLAIGDDDPLTATATYTNDAENNKEIYTAIATSADGSTIYNFTFNISLPTSQEFNVMAYENITATKLVAEWGIEYSWEGATEDWNIYIGADNMGNASGSFNDTYVMALEFEVEESMGMLSISGVFTDGTNTYQVYVMGALAPTEEPVVEPTDTITLTSDDLVVTNYPAALGFKGSINEKSGYTIEFTIYDATTYGNYGWDGEWPLIENVALSSDEESIWLDLQKETEVVYYKDETTGQDVVEGQFIDSKTNVLYVVTMKTVKPETPSDLENIAIDGKTVKSIINGQLIIVKDGVQYNAQGAILK